MPMFVLAPLLLAAGLVFTVLSLIPRARRWGIPFPTGILALGPCLLAIMAVEAILLGLSDRFIPRAGAYLHQHLPWAIYAPSVVAVLLVFLGGIAAGLAARFVASLLPRILLRLAVFVAAWCSYFVVFVTIEIIGNAVAWRKLDWRMEWLIAGLVAMLSGNAAYFMAKRSEDYRPQDLRLSWGTTFRKRSQASAEKATEASRA